MKLAIVIVAALAALVAVIAVIGLPLPAEHAATRERRLSAAPQQVFDLIADPARYPDWRPDVRAVVILSNTPSTS